MLDCRRSTTLQTVVQLLRLSNPVLSGPSSKHSFRLISYNQRERIWQAEQVGSGIRRADRSDVMRLLSRATRKALRESRAEMGHGDGSSRAADDENDSEVDEDRRSCSTTIGDLGMRSDDLLECLIGPSDAYIGSVGQPIRNATSHTAAERPYSTADRYPPQERSWSRSQRRDRPRSRSPPARMVRPW